MLQKWLCILPLNTWKQKLQIHLLIWYETQSNFDQFFLLTNRPSSSRILSLFKSFYKKKIKQQVLLFVPEASFLIQTFLALVSGSSWHITMQVDKPMMTVGHENDHANRASTLYVACKNPIKTRFFFIFFSFTQESQPDNVGQQSVFWGVLSHSELKTIITKSGHTK